MTAGFLLRCQNLLWLSSRIRKVVSKHSDKTAFLYILGSSNINLLGEFLLLFYITVFLSPWLYQLHSVFTSSHFSRYESIFLSKKLNCKNQEIQHIFPVSVCFIAINSIQLNPTYEILKLP